MITTNSNDDNLVKGYSCLLVQNTNQTTTIVIPSNESNTSVNNNTNSNTNTSKTSTTIFKSLQICIWSKLGLLLLHIKVIVEKKQCRLHVTL